MQHTQKKLFVLIGSLEVGGTERHLVSVLPKLVEQGWSIHVFTFTQKGPLAITLEEQGVRVATLLKPSQVKMLQRFPRLLGRFGRITLCVYNFMRQLRQKNDPNILLHFYLPESYVLGTIAASLAGFSGHKIMSRRSLNTYQTRRPGVAWCEKWLHKKMALIIGNSQAILEQLLEEGVPKSRLRLIYNGVDMQAFMQHLSKDAVRKKLNIPADSLVLIKVANLIHYKGHQDLLNALSDIKGQLPSSWYLLCVGRDDGIGEALKKEANALGIAPHILWLGSRTDVSDLLASSDIGVLCSHEEGFSNAILEGMGAGLPMVVTDVGGNKEAVIHGETGYVVPAKDPKSLGLAILTLARNSDTAKAFGAASHQRATQQFTIDSCVESYIALYDALLNHQPLPILNS